MSDADSAMMCRPLSVPRIHKAARAIGKAIVTVGVADAQHLSWDAFALCYQQLEAALRILNDRQ